MIDENENAFVGDLGFAIKLDELKQINYRVVGTTQYYPYEMV